MEVTVADKQSLLDISLQTLGSAEAVFELAAANDVSVVEDLIAGQQLSVPEVSDYIRRQIVNYYDINRIKPATAIDAKTQQEALNEGVEFWRVEMDFMVS